MVEHLFCKQAVACSTHVLGPNFYYTINTVKTLQKHMDEVMDYFDFERVHKTMTYLKWKWHGSSEVPTIAELRRHVRDQMERVYADKCYAVNSGGFKTIYQHGIEKGIKWDHFEVAFIVSDWDTNDE